MTAPETLEASRLPTHTRPAEGRAVPPTRWQRWATRGRLVLAMIGTVTVVGLSAALALDVAAFDPTSGGYEAPYTDYTGEPIDWDADTYDTPEGMVGTGRVVDVHVDCTSGMITAEVLGSVRVDFRELSDRALAVHGPREACADRGFRPEF